MHAAPEVHVTRGEAAAALAAYFGKRLRPREAADYAVRQGWMAVDHRNWFHGDLPFDWTDWRGDKLPGPLPGLESRRPGPVRRLEHAVSRAGRGRERAAL